MLDRYIARLYLVNVLALMVLLFSFVVTVDVALNIDRYIDAATEMMARRGAAAAAGNDTAAAGSPTGGGAIRKVAIVLLLVADLWWPRLLQLFNFMLGLILVGGMGFTLARLVRSRELVACMAAGVSLRRMARPFLVVALLMTCLQVLNQEFVLPRIAPLLTRDHKQAGRRDFGSFAVLPTRDSAGRVLFARRFDPATGELADLRIWERDERGRALRQINAASARWNGQAWVLSGASSRDEAGKVTPPPESIRTDADPTWLLLRRYQGLGNSLSWSQLSAMLNTGKLDHNRAEDIRRISLGRISIIVCNFLALFITMPFFLLREPRNLVLQSLKCAPLGMLALMGAVLGAAAAVPGLPASFSVFLPVLVLIPVAVAMFGTVRT